MGCDLNAGFLVSSGAFDSSWFLADFDATITMYADALVIANIAEIYARQIL